MTNVYVRRLEHRVPRAAGADLVIDLLDHPSRSNVQHDLGAILRSLGEPSPLGQDLLALSAGAYVVDKVLLRKDADDAWTRDISLSVPVSSPSSWAASERSLRSALTFLSGDRWSFSWRAEIAPMKSEPKKAVATADVACLFSGGLDSLVGAINLLESNRKAKIALVGWYDTTQGGRSRREELASELARAYGKERVALVPIWLSPAHPASGQDHPLPEGEPERTTRARSFLYLSLAVAAADAMSANAPVVAPENGFIALNPPMTVARLGSLSTRTMHPHFLAKLTEAFRIAGLTHSIENPLRYQTKGEVLETCANPALLRKLFKRTVSCARSGRGRDAGRSQDNCGYCYPCIIRRAAAAAAGLDEPRDYRYDVRRDGGLFASSSDKGTDARAVFAGIRELSATRVIASGPLPSTDVATYLELIERGVVELRQFFMGASASIRAIAGLKT